MPEIYTSVIGGLCVKAFRDWPRARDLIMLDVYSRHGRNQEILSVAQPVVMSEITRENEAMSTTPVLSMNPETAQGLMDSLWECGLRPSEGAGSAGALAATQKHLDDMKRIAFHTLKINA